MLSVKMWRSLHISPPPSGMAAIRQIPLKEKNKNKRLQRKYYKILHAPTEAKKITLYKQTRKMQHVIKTSNQTRHRKK